MASYAEKLLEIGRQIGWLELKVELKERELKFFEMLNKAVPFTPEQKEEFEILFTRARQELEEFQQKLTILLNDKSKLTESKTESKNL